MMNGLSEDERTELLELFRLYATKFYPKIIVEWITNNWQAIEDQHLQLINYLKDNHS
jgi:hypothetical protein